MENDLWFFSAAINYRGKGEGSSDKILMKAVFFPCIKLNNKSPANCQAGWGKRPALSCSGSRVLYANVLQRCPEIKEQKKEFPLLLD